MLGPLDKTRLIVGLKQLRRGLNENSIERVILAQNAERRVLDPVVAQCQAQNIPVEWAASMQELGKACGIEVGAAAAGIRKDPA